MIKKTALPVGTLFIKLLRSLKRFPEAVLFAAATVSILIYINHYGVYPGTEITERLGRIAMTLALGIPLSLSVKVFFERVSDLKKGIKLLIYAAGVGVLILYYFYLLTDFNMVPVSRYIAISFSLYAAFAFIPYFFRKEKFELYVIKLFISFFITCLYSLILFAGLAAILFTIHTLFSLDISDKLYYDIWLIVAGIFAPAFFLADIPRYGEELHVENYPKVLKVLLLYIVMPLLSVYSAILYVYFIKIVATWHWPEGMVSNLVLWYSIISTLVIFFIHPLRSTNRWADIFSSLFPKLILPLLAMMFVAMGIRINAYGITESRYFVMLAGLWVTGCMIYFIFSRRARNIILPVTLAIIAVLSVSGPWSCYSVSKLSQNNRLEKILTAHDMIKDKTIIKPSGDLPETDRKEISAIIRYFDRYHSLDDVRFLPKDFRIADMENVFGFPMYYDYRSPDNDREYFRHSITEHGGFLDITGYDYFSDFPAYRDANLDFSGEQISISYTPQNREIKITKEGRTVYSRNVSDLAIELHKDYSGEDMLKMSQMSYSDQNDQVKILYVFTHFSGWEDRSTGDITLDAIEFYLFVKLKE